MLRPAIVRFLKVCIARSSLLMRCLCGSTNCSFIFSYSRYFFTDLDYALSIILRTGLEPVFCLIGDLFFECCNSGGFHYIFQ